MIFRAGVLKPLASALRIKPRVRNSAEEEIGALMGENACRGERVTPQESTHDPNGD